MTQFASLIRDIGARLQVPQPARSRILLEIAADLDDLYDHHVAQGRAPAEAAERARATLELSDEALTSLITLHQPPVRRLLDQLSEQARAAWERSMLAVVALCILVFTIREVGSVQALQTASRFVWPTLGIAVVAALVALSKVYTLYVKQDHDVRWLRRGLDLLLFLTAASIAVGLFGLVVELASTVRRIAAGAGWGGDAIVECLIRSSTLMILSMLVAIAIAVLWFVLLAKVQSIERAETEVLLMGNGVEESVATNHLLSSSSSHTHSRYSVIT